MSQELNAKGVGARGYTVGRRGRIQLNFRENAMMIDIVSGLAVLNYVTTYPYGRLLN